MSVPKLELPGYTQVAVLGVGVSGEVFQATKNDAKEKKTVVIKRYLPDTAESGGHKRELAILRHLQSTCNPYLTCYLDCIQTPGATKDHPARDHLILEFLGQYVTLATFARKHHELLIQDPAGLNPIRRIFSNMLDAIASLHAAGVAHRDIKPDNMMINLDTLHIRIIDFDQSCTLTPTGSTACEADFHGGTPDFMAPEDIQHHMMPSENKKIKPFMALTVAKERKRAVNHAGALATDIWQTGMSFMDVLEYNAMTSLSIDVTDAIAGLYLGEKLTDTPVDKRILQDLNREDLGWNRYGEELVRSVALGGGSTEAKSNAIDLFRTRLHKNRLLADALNMWIHLSAPGGDMVSYIMRFMSDSDRGWAERNADVMDAVRAALDFDPARRKLVWADAPLRIRGYEMTGRMASDSLDAQVFLARSLEHKGATLLVKRFSSTADRKSIERERKIIEFLKKRCQAFAYCAPASGEIVDSGQLYSLFQFHIPTATVSVSRWPFGGGSSSSSSSKEYAGPDGTTYISVREYMWTRNFFNDEYEDALFGNGKEEVPAQILANMVRALRETHQSGVIHRNLNLDTVLIETHTLDVRIIGFGDACLLPDQAHAIAYVDYLCPFPGAKFEAKQLFNASFAAPEQYLGDFKPTTRQDWIWIDIWAMGMAFVALLGGMYDPLRYNLLDRYRQTEAGAPDDDTQAITEMLKNPKYKNILGDLMSLEGNEKQLEWLRQHRQTGAALASMLRVTREHRSLL